MSKPLNNLETDLTLNTLQIKFGRSLVKATDVFVRDCRESGEVSISDCATALFEVYSTVMAKTLQMFDGKDGIKVEVEVGAVPRDDDNDDGKVTGKPLAC